MRNRRERRERKILESKRDTLKMNKIFMRKLQNGIKEITKRYERKRN